jgi:hypothetical protein
MNRGEIYPVGTNYLFFPFRGQKETKSFILKGVLQHTGFRLYKISAVAGFFFT